VVVLTASGEGKLFNWGRLKEALKKISAGLRPVRAIQAHAFLEVAVACQEFESRLDEGFRTLAG
jgi:hypothetical protein